MGKRIGVLALMCFWGIFAPGSRAQTIVLRGFITDGQSGQPLQGATVLLQSDFGSTSGGVSNSDGVYQISDIEPGVYSFTVRFLGFATVTDTLELGDRPFEVKSVTLQPQEELLEEVVVEAEGGAARIEAGLQTIRPTDLQRIPTPDVSGDLATYLQSLPGIISVGDRGGQLFIRGGTPSQNMVLVDGQLIYQPFHILGFFSAFPEELVSLVDLYAGGFGARYSGRISSVIDVKTRDGNIQERKTAVSLSPFLAGLNLEGPLVRGSSGYLVSMRSSVIERTAPVLFREDLPFRFGDVFVKLHNVEGERARCSLTSMFTYDRGRIDPDLASDDVFRWNNTVLGGRCISLPVAAPVLFELTGGFSKVTNEVGSAVNPERRSNVFRVDTEIHLTRYFSRLELSWGLFARMNWLSYRLGEQYQNVENNKDVLLNIGGYAEARYRFGEGLRITPGLAMNTYLGDYSASLDPRLRISWKPAGEEGSSEWSAAFGKYTQTLVGAIDERDAGSAFIAWMPAPLNSAQSQAIHGLLGWQRNLGSGFRFALEGYYKRFKKLPVPIWSTIARFTTTLVNAKGSTRGIDSRLEFQREHVYAYAGYGYSWTEYKIAQDQFSAWFDEPIQTYHPPHDRRHQLNLVLSVDIGRFNASARWQYGSGLPYTRPIGFDELIALRDVVDVRRHFGTTRVLYDRPYQGILPAYHRLDLSIEREFPTSIGLLAAQLGAINVYDRSNLFYFDVFRVRRVNQLPVLPVLSIKLEID